MNRSIDDIKGYLVGIVSYFKRNIENDPLFEPEYRIGELIVEQIEKSVSVDEILKTVNSINKIKHYNGSGWCDFQNQLCQYFEAIGVPVEMKGEEFSTYLKKMPNNANSADAKSSAAD